MKYSYVANGTLNDLSATLFCNGKEVSFKEGLKDEKALKNWARNAAEQHKWETAEAAQSTFTIAANGSFTV